MPRRTIEALQRIAEKRQLSAERRELYFCGGLKNGKCCGWNDGGELWEHVKKRVDALNREAGREEYARTLAACLRVCVGGPIIRILPDNVWYWRCTTRAVLDMIIDKHLVGGTPVWEYVFCPEPAQKDGRTRR